MKNNKKALFTSNSDHWATPDYIKNFIKEIFFDGLDFFDPCPYNDNYIINGLDIEWDNYTFCNPPYSKINKWVDKAIDEFNKGKNIVLLIPARTDTKYFKKIFDYKFDLYFISGRISFSNKGSAPFPSVIVHMSNCFFCNNSNYYNIDREEMKKFNK